MQIKVNATRMHITKQSSTHGPIQGMLIGHAFRVPVAEGKLVLVEGKTNNLDLPVNGEIMINSRMMKPTIISETEKIEVGDWVFVNDLPHDPPSIFKALKIEQGHLSVHSKVWISDKDYIVLVLCKKVIALPEHFSPKHLQAIVDGKIKDGDKVLVECEKNIKYNKIWWCEEHKPVKYKNLSNVIPTSIYQEGDSKGLHYKVHIALPTGEMKVNLDEIEIEENNQMIIKLNQSNHITLHKVEEKMLPMNKVKIACERAFHGIIVFPGDTTLFSEWWKEHQKWFEQNVK